MVVEMIDTVRIPPWNFHRQLNDAIAEELNKKLANKASPAYPQNDTGPIQSAPRRPTRFVYDFGHFSALTCLGLSLKCVCSLSLTVTRSFQIFTMSTITHGFFPK